MNSSPRCGFCADYPGSHFSSTPYRQHWKMESPLRAIKYPDSKVHGANMGPIWGRQNPGGPHVGPMNFAIWLDYQTHIMRYVPLTHWGLNKMVAISRRQFQMHFLKEHIWISIKILLECVPKGAINNIPALVHIMAWRRLGDKPLSELMMVRSLTHICITPPQWVNWLAPLRCGCKLE